MSMVEAAARAAQLMTIAITSEHSQELQLVVDRTAPTAVHITPAQAV